MSTVSETEGSTKPEETETEGSTKPEEKEIPRLVEPKVEEFVKANIDFEIEKLKKDFNKRNEKTIHKLDKRLEQSEKTIHKLGEFAKRIVKEKKSPDAQKDLEKYLNGSKQELEEFKEAREIKNDEEKSGSQMDSESLITRRKEEEFLF